MTLKKTRKVLILPAQETGSPVPCCVTVPAAIRIFFTRVNQQRFIEKKKKVNKPRLSDSKACFYIFSVYHKYQIRQIF